ncbi:MAG: transcriptional regulator [Clostridia bacterium]|nr:transcriptional regulator [Clostridia bacterium]
MGKKYEKIVEDIEKLVAGKQLKQGQKLPAIRVMAEQYKCNKSTVIRAYKELEMNYKIYGVPKSGYYLVEGEKFDEEVSERFDFREVLLDPKLLPYKEFNHCINRAVALYKNSLFSYGRTEGLESLRKVLVTHLQSYQVFTSIEKICITSGAQQALSILVQMPFPNGRKTILVEEPTYSLIHELIEMNGNQIMGINRTLEGIDLHELECLFKNEAIKFFYTIPRLHNPLGTSYSEKEKKEILRLAQKYDVYIVEDDYLADIDTHKKVLPMHYYDVWERIIYIKSFSKAFMPGIRIGTVVLQEAVKNDFLKYKKHYDLSTSALSQGALEIFINSGMYKKHNEKTQRIYQQKMNSLREYLSSFNKSQIEVFIPHTGLFIWMKLPETLNLELFIKRLEEKNVYIASGEMFFITKQSGERVFRLAIAHLSKEQIKAGMKILFKELIESLDSARKY